MNNCLFQIRVTGLIVENNKLLLVKQRVSLDRTWSLPGGRLEHGETLEQGIVREIYEETGLHVRVNKLLYICEKLDTDPPLLHITFLLQHISGDIRFPTNEFDENPICDVKWVYIDKLTDYGFSMKFQGIVKDGFPQSGNYMGFKSSIGL